jgi:hypothetical protein
LLDTAYALADALIANNADLENRNQTLITATGAAREAVTSFQQKRSR